MTKRYLFDTNTVRPLYDPRDANGHLRPAVEALVREDGGLTLSAVGEYEIRRGLETRKLDPANQPSRALLGAAERLLSAAHIVGLDWEHWKTAAGLWALSQRRGMGLQEGDLLIAATAFANSRKLVTVDWNLATGLKALGHEAQVMLLEPPPPKSH